MPCHEPSTLLESRLNEFLTAALCYASSKLNTDELAGFPGLLEWRIRHTAIDAISESHKSAYISEYDRRTGDHTTPNERYENVPKFIKQFAAAFPKGKR